MKSIRTEKDKKTGITKFKVKKKGKKEVKQKTLFWFIFDMFKRLSKQDLDEKEKTHRISRAFKNYYRTLQGKSKHPDRQISLMCYSYLKKTRKLLGISTFKTKRRKTTLGKDLLAA